MLCYAIDGQAVKVSNYACGLIPPPMCHKVVGVDHNVIGCDVNGDDMLIFT